MVEVGEQISAAPFIAWIEEQLECLRRDETLRDNNMTDIPAERVLADRLGVTPRILYRFRRGVRATSVNGVEGEYPTDTFPRARVEDMLDHAGTFLWEIYDDLPADPPLAAERRAWNRKMTDREILAAHKLYTHLNLSSIELAERLYQRFGYANAIVCQRCLLVGFARLGLDRRPRFARVRYCEAITAKGSPCRNIVRPNGALCAIHDPATADAIRDAVRRGHKQPAHLPAELLLTARTMHQEWGMSMREIGRRLIDDSPFAHPVTLSRLLTSEARDQNWYRGPGRPGRKPGAVAA